MKKVLLGLVGLGLLLPAFALAATIRGGESQSLAADQVVSDDLYMFGSTVLSAGSVRGDLLSGGGTVLVTGSVDGTLQAAGGTVSVTGNVGQSVRAAGGTIVVSGTVGKDVMAAGGTLEISGKVGRDLYATGGMVTLNAPVNGNVQINSEKVIIGSKTVINGTLTYRSPTEAQIDPAAKINKIEYIPAALPNHGRGLAQLFTFWLIAKFVMSFVMAMLLVWLARRFTTNLATDAFTHPVMDFFVGLAGLILIPIISVIFCITVVGLPIGLIGIFGYIVLMILSSLLAPLLLGSLIFKWFTKSAHYEITWQSALLGVVIYTVFGLIPIVGWLLKFIFIPLTLGAVLKAKRDIIKNVR
jgi:hypothetical protein